MPRRRTERERPYLKKERTVPVTEAPFSGDMA